MISVKQTIKEVSKACNVSVRTLHHYDQIGLLSPSERTDAGYRLYGEAELIRLQQILFFRELDFSLKEIKILLDLPGFNLLEALRKHRSLLLLKKERITRLISLTNQILEGEAQMDFKILDNQEISTMKDQYRKEVEQRWKDTSTYKKYHERTRTYTKEVWKEIERKMQNFFQELNCLKPRTPDDPVVQEWLEKYRSFIDEYFYPCSKDTLIQLSELYISDERFQQFIDREGDGLSTYLHQIITFACTQ